MTIDMIPMLGPQGETVFTSEEETTEIVLRRVRNLMWIAKHPVLTVLCLSGCMWLGKLAEEADRKRYNCVKRRQR
jgi:hypothetical protein